MEEVEIMIDGKKVKTISKLSKEEIDDNSMRLLLDDTVELDDLIKEIKNGSDIVIRLKRENYFLNI